MSVRKKPGCRDDEGDAASLFTILGTFLLLVHSCFLSAAAPAHVSITFEQPVRDANYPELVYWFVTPETFAPGQVARDIQHMADDTYFNFPFLTERNGVLLSKDPKPNGFVPPSCPKWPPWCESFSGNAGSHHW